MIQKIKKAYQYLFYKLYISLEAYSSPRFWSEWKAASLLVLIIYSIFYSLILYYEIFIDRNSSYGNNFYLIIGFAIFISVINYYIFLSRDRWKQIVDDYNKLPKIKNRIGTFLCLLFFLGCIANFIYAFYLFSQVDWSLYR